MIIKLSDVNVDGCGTNVDTLLEIGINALTPSVTEQIVTKIKNRINAFNEQNEDWDTNDVLTDVSELLNEENIAYRWLSEDEVIEF